MQLPPNWEPETGNEAGNLKPGTVNLQLAEQVRNLPVALSD
jgi:hypothetical protein